MICVCALLLHKSNAEMGIRMKKVIITGPTGAIGIALIQELVMQGIEVTAVCHRESKRLSRIPSDKLVQVVECDLEELFSLTELLEHDYDVFYHFAWACTTGDSRNNVEGQLTNLNYTIDAVEVAALLGCKRFIGAGSQAEYGRYEGMLNTKVPTFPENGYGMAKLCAGQMSRLRCQQLGIEHIWTRVLSVYGPFDGENTLIISMIRKLLQKETPKCTKGEQIWDYIYSKDTARAFRLLGEKGIDGKTYCIGSGVGIPLKEYILTIRDQIDETLAVGLGEVPYGDKQVMYLCADISELEADTGFQVKYSFDEGIRETIEWCKENH